MIKSVTGCPICILFEVCRIGHTVIASRMTKGIMSGHIYDVVNWSLVQLHTVHYHILDIRFYSKVFTIDIPLWYYGIMVFTVHISSVYEKL